MSKDQDEGRVALIEFLLMSGCEVTALTTKKEGFVFQWLLPSGIRAEVTPNITDLPPEVEDYLTILFNEEDEEHEHE